MIEIEIATNSTNSIAATLFTAEKEQAVLIIASATGVKQSFYKKFAEFLAAKGVTVITFDYQGIGRSLNQRIADVENNAEEWGSIGLENVIAHMLKYHPRSKKYILGHSIGGQLIGFAKSAIEVDKIILVAAQSGYWKYWKGTGRVKMWFNWYVLFPTLVSLFGYMPSKKISGMENLPKNVAKQWNNWGKDPEYLFSDIRQEASNFDAISSRMTAFSIADDVYAPKAAVNWMTQKYSKATVKEIHLIPSDYNSPKIGHFGIFREKFQHNLWQLLLKEID